MKRRCYNPKSPNFKWYGGRGITVCDRWLGVDGFANFMKDMGTPLKGFSLDRINNDGNYEPGNCRWATGLEQGRNRRKKESIRQRAQSAGLPYHVVYERIKRFNWDPSVALSTPVRLKGHMKTKLLVVRMSEAEDSRLRKEAREAGKTVSEMVRGRIFRVMPVVPVVRPTPSGTGQPVPAGQPHPLAQVSATVPKKWVYGVEV